MEGLKAFPSPSEGRGKKRSAIFLHSLQTCKSKLLNSLEMSENGRYTDSLIFGRFLRSLRNVRTFLFNTSECGLSSCWNQLLRHFPYTLLYMNPPLKYLESCPQSCFILAFPFRPNPVGETKKGAQRFLSFGLFVYLCSRFIRYFRFIDIFINGKQENL